jgi:hypothetical protein
MSRVGMLDEIIKKEAPAADRVVRNPTSPHSDAGPLTSTSWTIFCWQHVHRRDNASRAIQLLVTTVICLLGLEVATDSLMLQFLLQLSKLDFVPHGCRVDDRAFWQLTGQFFLNNDAALASFSRVLTNSHNLPSVFRKGCSFGSHPFPSTVGPFHLHTFDGFICVALHFHINTQLVNLPTKQKGEKRLMHPCRGRSAKLARTTVAPEEKLLFPLLV